MSLPVKNIFLISMLVAAVFLQPVYAANVLVFNTTGKPPLNAPDQSGFMDRVAAEALRRIGIQLKTVQLPAERGLQNVNAGIDDGEMSRIAGLQKQYPNLLQVPETIMDWEFHAFSAENLSLENKWADLAGYSVAFIGGWKIVEKNVPASSVVTTVKSPAQLFGLLKKQRTDVVVYERWGGLKLIDQFALSNVKIIQPPLAQKKMYMYLNKKHSHIVSKLAGILKQMKEDGSYQKIYATTLGQYVK